MYDQFLSFLLEHPELATIVIALIFVVVGHSRYKELKREDEKNLERQEKITKSMTDLSHMLIGVSGSNGLISDVKHLVKDMGECREKIYNELSRQKERIVRLESRNKDG